VPGGSAQRKGAKQGKAQGTGTGARKGGEKGAAARARAAASDGDSVDSSTSASGSESGSSDSDGDEDDTTASSADGAGAGSAAKSRAARKKFKTGVYVPLRAVVAVAAADSAALEIAPGVTLHGLRRGAALSLNGDGVEHTTCVSIVSGSVSLFCETNKADTFDLAAGGLFLTQGAAVTVVAKVDDTVVVAHGAAAAE
jgi:hypothetical protein